MSLAAPSLEPCARPAPPTPCRTVWPAGAISRAEFFRPEVGLLDYVRTNLLRQRVALVPVPDISQD